MVTDSRDARALRTAGRLNEPRRRVSKRTSTARRGRSTITVVLVREEWRVLDRWWTDEPVMRRYFEVVLETGENTVVFNDGAGGGWFTQRGV